MTVSFILMEETGVSGEHEKSINFLQLPELQQTILVDNINADYIEFSIFQHNSIGDSIWFFRKFRRFAMESGMKSQLYLDVRQHMVYTLT